MFLVEPEEEGGNAESQYLLDGEAKNGDDAIHRLVLPPHGAAPISAVVPVAGGGRVQTRPVLLHDHAGHDVLERLLELRQAGQAGLHHPVCPLVHLGVHVAVAPYSRLYRLLNHVGHLESDVISKNFKQYFLINLQNICFCLTSSTTNWVSSVGWSPILSIKK